MGFHLLSFWPCGPYFPFILAGLHFLSFWPCWPSFPFILAFWRLASGGPHKLPKTVRFPKVPYKEFSSARPGSIFQFLAFWALISFHFGLLGLHFLSFWPFGPSFPFILALWAFISFHFGLVGLHFLAFWPFVPSFPCILAFCGSASGVHPPQVAKNCPFAQCPYNGFISAVTGSILQFLAPIFGFFGLHFLSFWPFGPSFAFILAFWATISFHFGLHFSFILAFWAFISFHFGLLGFHFPYSPCGPSFPFIVAFWAFISLHFGFLVASLWGPHYKSPNTVRFQEDFTL